MRTAAPAICRRFSRVTLGIGVTDTGKRHPATTAQAAATLNLLARGRAGDRPLRDYWLPGFAHRPADYVQRPEVIRSAASDAGRDHGAAHPLGDDCTGMQDHSNFTMDEAEVSTMLPFSKVVRGLRRL